MDWQKVPQKPQFWDKFHVCPLWTAITRTLEVQLTWILFLWTDHLQGLVMATENGPKVLFLARVISVQSIATKWHFWAFFTKRRHYFGFHCFCFHCQDFGRFLLNPPSLRSGGLKSKLLQLSIYIAKQHNAKQTWPFKLNLNFQFSICSTFKSYNLFNFLFFKPPSSFNLF